MKKIVLLILSICCFGAAYGIKLEDRYIMRPLDKGHLYFIVPFDIPGHNMRMKEMSADITYLTQNDSVTLNMSIWTATELVTDSIVWDGKKRIVVRDFQTFFIERDNKLWLHRYSIKLHLSDLILLYSAIEPYKIILYDHSASVSYGYSIKQWNKEQQWMNDILHIIISNKKLNKELE